MIKIAIPTHKRIDIIESKVLKLLEWLDYETTIFPNPSEDIPEYKKLLWDRYNIVDLWEYKSIWNFRHKMLDYYKEWDRILMIDDDIGKLYTKHWDTINECDSKTKKNIIETMFDYIDVRWQKLRWVYPVNNPFFMWDRISKNKFLINCFMGIIKTELNFDKNLYSKEDYDFTLQNIVKYGWVSRLDFVTTDNKYWKTKGWLQANPIRTEKTEQDIVYLEQKWRDLIKRNTKRPWEILFNFR